jgi:hypothetical protein
MFKILKTAKVGAGVIGGNLHLPVYKYRTLQAQTNQAFNFVFFGVLFFSC